MGRNRTNAAVLWRGILAGLIGGPLCLLGLALVQVVKLGYVPYGGALEIMALPVFLLMGGVYGTVIALMFWLFALRGMYPSAIGRAIVGALIPFLFVTILNWARSGENTGVYPPTPMEAIGNAIAYVTSFGVLPGIAAAPKNQ